MAISSIFIATFVLQAIMIMKNIFLAFTAILAMILCSCHKEYTLDYVEPDVEEETGDYKFIIVNNSNVSILCSDDYDNIKWFDLDVGEVSPTKYSDYEKLKFNIFSLDSDTSGWMFRTIYETLSKEKTTIIEFNP